MRAVRAVDFGETTALSGLLKKSYARLFAEEQRERAEEEALDAGEPQKVKDAQVEVKLASGDVEVPVEQVTAALDAHGNQVFHYFG